MNVPHPVGGTQDGESADIPDEPQGAEAYVVLDGLRHCYRRSVLALSDVHAQWPGGAIALLGPNGAGKSTLLRILVGDLTPTSGSVSFPAGQSGGVRLGYLPQQASWPGHFTVEEFALYFCWVHGVPSRHRRARVAEAIEAVDLVGQAGTRLSALSGGQHRRAMLTQALVGDPAVLVLDEPTSGFDPGQRILFRKLVGRIGAERTVILSTHLIEDVESLASWVTVLDKGRVAFDGTASSFTARGSGTGPEAGARSGASPMERAYLRVLGIRS